MATEEVEGQADLLVHGFKLVPSDTEPDALKAAISLAEELVDLDQKSLLRSQAVLRELERRLAERPIAIADMECRHCHEPGHGSDDCEVGQANANYEGWQP